MERLIFTGGISYLVVIDLFRVRRFSKFALNTKLVLAGTAILLFIGFAAIFLLEFNNPDTLGELPLTDKITVSLFQSISDRTAGFGIVDTGKAHEGTNVLQMALMFIGGASASVAGGIKVNTMAVVVIALIAQIRHRNNVSGVWEGSAGPPGAARLSNREHVAFVPVSRGDAAEHNRGRGGHACGNLRGNVGFRDLRAEPGG